MDAICHRHVAASTQTTQSIFTVPFRRNPYFVSRTDIFTHIRVAANETGVVALCGPSGVGKSQIAIEYAYQFRSRFPQANVLWIHAGNTSQIRRTYEHIAENLKLPHLGPDTAGYYEVLNNWAKSESAAQDKEPWLMIWDNFDDHGVIEEPSKAKEEEREQRRDASGMIPNFSSCPLGQRRVLMLTTQSQEVAITLSRSQSRIEVHGFSRADSAQLFYARLTDAWCEASSASKIALLNILADVPFAVTYAVATLKRAAWSITELVDRINRSNEINQRNVDTCIQGLHQSVAWPRSAFQACRVLLECIIDHQGYPIELLSLMSHLDSQHMPLTFLRSIKRPTTEVTKSLVSLLTYSIVVVEEDVGFLSIHPLFQSLTRSWLDTNNLALPMARVALQLTASALATEDQRRTEDLKPLLPHAKAVLRHNLKFGNDDECADLMHNIAYWEWRLGYYGDAYQTALDASSIREKLFGWEAESTLASQSLVALSLRYMCHYTQAAEVNRRNLCACARVLGPNHTKTLMSRNNLVLVLRDLQKYVEAEALGRQNLEHCVRILGSDHTFTSTAAHNLALVLGDQSKFVESEAMCRQALAIREHTLTREHPTTLTSFYCLAHLLHRKRFYAEASSLYSIAHIGFRNTLGPSHPVTAACEEHFLDTIKDWASCIQLTL